jgi:VIT1/CCC1 family predicted Fe2+/Mn2+ transporter
MPPEPEKPANPATRIARAIRLVDRHAANKPPRHEPHSTGGTWLRDVILGGQDGLVNMLGIELGIIAAGASTAVLITTGLAAAITESISMGAVSYTSSLAERDYYLAQQAQEQREVDATPEEEEDEVRQIYAAKGFDGDLLDAVVRTITSNRETWVGTMMDEELHLEPVETSRVLRGAAVVLLATLIGHFVPLWSFIVLRPSPTIALVVSIAFSGVVLFGVGVYQAKTLVGDWRTSGLKMVVIGLGAAAIGFFVGHLFHTTGS